MPRPDRHNEVEINLLRSGSLTYLLGGRRTVVKAGRLALFWGAVPHQIIQWETKEPYFVATLPLAWFLACGFPDTFAGAVLGAEIVCDLKADANDELRFQQWIADLHSGEPLQKRTAQMEIQARLLRVAIATRSKSKSASEKSATTRTVDPNLSRADEIACYIARHYHEPLTADQIAKAVNLHPNYAMNLFRTAFGTTMNDFITQHRLSHAQRLLVTTSDSVVEIAFASGFQSLSRFNEAFKKSCGCSPREYRKRQTSISSD